MFERGTAVQAHTGNAGNSELDDQHISLLAGRVVAGCTPDGTHRAVGKGLGIKAGSGLGILIVPDANCVLCHSVPFACTCLIVIRTPTQALWAPLCATTRYDLTEAESRRSG